MPRVVEPIAEFRSFYQWVEKAQRWIGGTGAVCIDAKNRRCTRGEHFMRAHDDGSFPVKCYTPEDALWLEGQP